MAYEHFGARWGQGEGLQGLCYVIPTMQGGVETIEPYVNGGIAFAQQHPEYKFLVTRIGCGIAGFHDDEIAPLFSKAFEMDNVILPREFVEVIQCRHKSRFNLERFLNAQKKNYEEALQEIQDGNQQTDWIWYVFPQLQILGHSWNSRYFGISGYEEAEEYLNHPILGRRLREVTEAFLAHRELSATDIFGHLDDKKVQSCMTLFDAVSPDDIYEQVLEVFYYGNGDKKTLDFM